MKLHIYIYTDKNLRGQLAFFDYKISEQPGYIPAGVIDVPDDAIPTPAQIDEILLAHAEKHKKTRLAELKRMVEELEG